MRHWPTIAEGIVAAVVLCAACGVGSAAMLELDITTETGVGADSYIRGGTFAAVTHGTQDILAAKHAGDVDVRRTIYLRFDLTGVNIGDAIGAELRLRMDLPSTTTFSQVTLGVFALNDGYAGGGGILGENWSEQSLTWNNAPANSGNSDAPNSNATAVTSIVLNKTDMENNELLVIDHANLLGAVAADSNDMITFILTVVSPVTAGGLEGSAKFFSKEHVTWEPPTLRLRYVPEPGTWGMLGLAGVIALRRRRRRGKPL